MSSRLAISALFKNGNSSSANINKAAHQKRCQTFQTNYTQFPPLSCAYPQAPQSSININATILLKAKPIYISDKSPDKVISILGPALSKSARMRTTKFGMRIDCESPDIHSRLIRQLSPDQNKLNLHTFQIRHNKPFYAVIRHLHKSTPTKWISEQLTKLGYLALSINVIKNRLTKEPLNLFQLSILYKDKSTIEQLLDLKQLANHLITVEPQACQQVIQCHRCQKFGHTRNFCHRPFACVKCAGNHSSVSCTKGKSLPPKCANCKGQHTANYLGCIAYKNATSTRQLSNHSVGQPTTTTKQKTAIKTDPPKQALSRNKASDLKLPRLPANLSSHALNFIRNLSYAEIAAKQTHQQVSPPMSPPLQTLQNSTQPPSQKLQQPSSQHSSPAMIPPYCQPKKPNANRISSPPLRSLCQPRNLTTPKLWQFAQQPQSNPSKDSTIHSSSTLASVIKNVSSTIKKLITLPTFNQVNTLQRLTVSLDRLKSSLLLLISPSKTRVNSANIHTQVNKNFYVPTTN